MDALLLLAIEADKEAKRKSEPVCKMADSVGDVQKAVRNIVQSVHTLSGDVAKVAEIATEAKDAATKAANKKQPKQKDYVMEVVRDDKDKITRIDVRAV